MAAQHALLLGMVFSEENSPKRGQEFRDRVRCQALESLGYDVKTLDDKHSDIGLEGKHCQAKFTDARRMLSSMTNKWGRTEFDAVVLDYFFSPVGWARTRWTEPFYRDTLPLLAHNHILATGGKVYLPNLDCTVEMLNKYASEISKYYTQSYEKDPLVNPLYRATESVEEELLKCPDAVTNVTQLGHITAVTDHPFVVLKVKAVFSDYVPVTPSTNGRTMRRTRYMEEDNIRAVALTVTEATNTSSKRTAVTTLKNVDLGGEVDTVRKTNAKASSSSSSAKNHSNPSKKQKR